MNLVLNIPLEFNIRSDDGDQNGEIHNVVLPILSPRVGVQSEIMLNSNIDLLIRGEYIISDITGDWTYAEEQDNGDNVKTFKANWDHRGLPNINYQGWVFSLGIRNIQF